MFSISLSRKAVSSPHFWGKRNSATPGALNPLLSGSTITRPIPVSSSLGPFSFFNLVDQQCLQEVIGSQAVSSLEPCGVSDSGVMESIISKIFYLAAAVRSYADSVEEPTLHASVKGCLQARVPVMVGQQTCVQPHGHLLFLLNQARNFACNPSLRKTVLVPLSGVPPGAANSRQIDRLATRNCY
eukprot:scaffold101308_cov15-Tisochrysis_lutea.AAC.1